MTEQQTYWQQNDKSTMSKVLLMVAAFAAIMTVVAIGISIAL